MAERVEQEDLNQWYSIDYLEGGVVAFGEPYHAEENFFYLVKGSERDLLIDTGMGIKSLADPLMKTRNSTKEIVVVNTHWHFDHIGGNRNFQEVLVPHNAQEIQGIRHGWTHSMLQRYEFEEGFQQGHPESFNPNVYAIEGYNFIQSILTEGYQIDLGDRHLSVVETPGHSPGSVCLFDEESGALFSSDLIYDGPLYCFEAESSPDQYFESLQKIKRLEPKTIHPGHNHSVNSPALINQAIDLFERSKSQAPDRTEMFQGFPIAVYGNSRLCVKIRS